MRNVKDFGAIGNGLVKDTAAIQRAIDAGGTVYFPPGIYLTGTLFLRSHGGLHLETGAVLLGSLEPEDYKVEDPGSSNHVIKTTQTNDYHLIVARKLENVFIRGGRIDGRSVDFYAGQPETLGYGGRKTLAYPPWKPTQMLFFQESKNVRIEDVELVNSPFWHCFLHGCDWVTIRGVHINSSPMEHNNDGIDIDCCTHVTVSNCIIDTGDDALTFRSNPKYLTDKCVCEYVTVSNCVLRSEYAHALRIGVGGGEIRHGVFSNIVMNNTRGAIWICSKYSNRSRGVDISDLAFDQIHAEAVNFLFIRHDYKYIEGVPFTGTLKDIRFSRLSGRTQLPFLIEGNGLAELANITMSDCQFIAGDPRPLSEQERKFFMIEEIGPLFSIKNATGVTLDKVRVNYDAPDAWCDAPAEINK
ncbi:MAG TPA: glycosyl hydrolase family 28 protein [Lentisphaeria bacterium]|nr:glycosyl hydrolase family 28 protein [Lentisphaeria bacterium]